jgi:hypothetical protein
MTKLEKLYSIIENSREVGVKLSKDVLQQYEETSRDDSLFILLRLYKANGSAILQGRILRP